MKIPKVLKQILSFSSNYGVLSMSQVINNLLNERKKRKIVGTDNAQDFVTEKSEMSKSKGPKGGRGRSRGDSNTRKTYGKCFHYGKQGHCKKY